MPLVQFIGGPENGNIKNLPDDEPRPLYIVSELDGYGWDSLGAPLPIYRDSYYHLIPERGVYEFQGDQLV